MKSTLNNLMMENVDYKHRNESSLKRLLKLTIPHMRRIIIAAICVLLINVSLIIKPYILKLVIDDFLIKHIPSKGLYSIVNMGILYLLVSISGNFFAYTQENLINKVGQDILRNLRGHVFKTIELLPLSYLDKNSSGRLITRATNDVEAISDMYTDVILNLFQDVFLLIGIMYAMFMLNFKLALISLSVLPIMSIILFLLKKKIKTNFLNMKTLIGKINGFMAESISGMKLIQLFRAELEKKKEFENLNDHYFKSTLLQVRLNSILKPGTQLFENLTIALILFYGVNKIGNHTLEIGVLYAFTTYIKQFFDPISDLADQYTTIQSALVSADRIFELLDQNKTLEDLDSGLSLDKIEGNIEFKNVWFAYNNTDWILKDLSFKVAKGETVAFVGETGAGKSTIISLINGFYKVQKGEILIDGININDIKLKVLRKNIAVVLQDVFLFSGTIKSNITLNDEIEDQKINEAVEMSSFNNFISNCENGIDEPVMERGNTLSAGEKQLISFARALAHDPSVFVFDEATANIDTQTEKLIQKAIDNISKGRTTLVIAHRLSTIRNANKIIVMKNGKIVEEGNHSELIKSGSYYSYLIKQNS
ncbi:ATP-binding cassette, subfamily B [Clostridium acidisoli DSM 12555]|uniref:ATP-binding cassette, subfamily B n=1 Tax=Clostridium acidisoli DSM 12555 TaxID=1121291 RepID=A0A1W1XMB8_9CLOT|nr:ABC transporter ATP-binding protein [Clostridium acidisoli]SMC24994.1 ATP-binding cassette, subfamily B [Clostridium acidisoli DSM 12555]